MKAEPEEPAQLQTAQPADLESTGTVEATGPAEPKVSEEPLQPVGAPAPEEGGQVGSHAHASADWMSVGLAAGGSDFLRARTPNFAKVRLKLRGWEGSGDEGEEAEEAEPEDPRGESRRATPRRRKKPREEPRAEPRKGNSSSPEAPPEPLRNQIPESIIEHGFVEVESLLPPELCEALAKLPMRNAEGISNAFQRPVRGRLLQQALEAIANSAAVSHTVEAAFGTPLFKVANVKILMAEFGAPAQIPHADDHCNRELFGICHLKKVRAPDTRHP